MKRTVRRVVDILATMSGFAVDRNMEGIMVSLD